MSYVLQTKGGGVEDSHGSAQQHYESEEIGEHSDGDDNRQLFPCPLHVPTLIVSYLFLWEAGIICGLSSVVDSAD